MDNDTVEQKKADNNLNNLAEEAAWNAGLIPAGARRAFLERNSLTVVLARRPDSKSSRENWWCLGDEAARHLSRLVWDKGWEVNFVLVNENLVDCQSYAWRECYISRETAEYWTVYPRTRK